MHNQIMGKINLSIVEKNTHTGIKLTYKCEHIVNKYNMLHKTVYLAALLLIIF